MSPEEFGFAIRGRKDPPRFALFVHTDMVKVLRLPLDERVLLKCDESSSLNRTDLMGPAAAASAAAEANRSGFAFPGIMRRSELQLQMRLCSRVIRITSTACRRRQCRQFPCKRKYFRSSGAAARSILSDKITPDWPAVMFWISQSTVATSVTLKLLLSNAMVAISQSSNDPRTPPVID